MSEFLYIYRGGVRDIRKQSPEEMQQVMQKWMTWMQGLAEKGHLKDRGHPLEPQGKLVSGGGKNVTDGPYAEKDLVGGYSLIEAKDLALAEDVVQDALCRALQVWKHHGMPDNPSAWLMTTAKNHAVDVLRRERTARTFAPEITRLLESEWTFRPTIEAAFGPHAIQDDELRMMFSCVDPRLTEEAQVALILHILCGFSVNEISNAFLCSAAAAAKRITRAKKLLATAPNLFELAGTHDFRSRLTAVHRALYLLFNEGYHGANSKTAVRVELCREAMRLATLLREHPLAATPATLALLALMCL